MKAAALRLVTYFFSAGIILFSFFPAFAQSNPAVLALKIQQIIDQPMYRHSSFGIEVYSLDDHRTVYERNAQKLFTSASTTKLVTEGSALEVLNADYRFHTRVYRTGPIDSDGTLHGDLVLVASGDPDLSGRVRSTGTLAYVKVGYDHSYDGDRDTKAVPGDPLLVINELAKQVASRGTKRVAGRVLIDVSLFPEGTAELGTGAIISPIVVNDNLIDVTMSPGQKPGAPVKLVVSPVTAYAKFINQATTAGAHSQPNVEEWKSDDQKPDGTHVIAVAGTMPAGGPSILYSYKVPQPSRFAEMAFVEELRRNGVQASFAPYHEPADFALLSSFYTDGNLVAEHTSPRFSEEVKVTLKVSQNLHASSMPYLLGAVLGHAKSNTLQAGFSLERAFLEKAGLDLTAASQSDGAGGDALFTPDFMCRFLAYMAQQTDFPLFEGALPILGRDGTLFNIQVHSPAAGHVFAKTGTDVGDDLLNQNLMLRGKGLAGYMTAADGRHYAFAIYADRVSLPSGNLDEIENTVGQTVGQIAAAIYSAEPQFALATRASIQVGSAARAPHPGGEKSPSAGSAAGDPRACSPAPAPAAPAVASLSQSAQLASPP